MMLLALITIIVKLAASPGAGNRQKAEASAVGVDPI
jgi:hypothetical protein